MSTTHLFNTLNNSANRYRHTSPHSIMMMSTNNILHSSPSTLSNNTFPITKVIKNNAVPHTQQSKITKPSKTKKATYLEGFDTVSFTANQSMFGVTRKRKSKPIEYEQVLNFGCIAPPSSENSVIPRKMRQSLDNYSNVSSTSSTTTSNERTSPRIVRTSISIRELLN